MRRAEPAAELNDGVVHVGSEPGHWAAHVPTSAAMPTEKHRETRNEVADLHALEEFARPGAECGNGFSRQSGEIRAAVTFTYTVQEKGDLGVVRDDFVLLQESN